MVKIAIAGATGFIGTRLVETLNTQSFSLLVLSRDPKRARRVFPQTAFKNLEIVGYAPTESGQWQSAIAGCEAVVNLAGAGIADRRWTPERKQEIRDSRVLVTQNLVEAIARAEPKPRLLVNASAVGYYGTSETAEFDESSPPGSDFLASVCQEWEAAAREVEAAGVRLVVPRLGIVLGEGGAIAKMLTPFKLFAGGPLGSGQQWFSWIHRDDVTGIIERAIDDSQLSGVYNACAPNPVRVETLCQTLGEVMNRPSWLPVPELALELLLGDGAKAVLEGQNVQPKRLQALGFEFRYPQLAPALEAIVRER